MKIYTLQVYFDSFINQKKQWDFLLGMADYIELILNDKDCKKYISDIKKSKKAFLIENKELEKLFSKKARIANDDYRDLVKASKISNQPDISLNGVSAEVKTYPKISEVEKKIKDGQGTTLWDAWDKICLAYLAVFKKDNVIIENQKQDEYDKWILKNNPELILQMKQLGSYDIKKTNRHLPALPNVIVGENYKLFVASIHKYLVEKLKEEEQAFSQVDIGYKQHKIPAKKGDKSHEEAVFTMLFHPKNRRIFINGIQVKKFTWESENCKVFEDAFNNPNTVREIKSKRRAQDFVNSFGFIRKAKSLFFPISAGRRLMLNNPIKRKDLKELGLEDITLKDLIADIRENSGNW